MSATLATALKAKIEAADLGVDAYRDRAPDGTTRPYVTISDGVSITAEPHGDQSDPNADNADTELVQVDLWQRLKSANPNDYAGSTSDPFEDPTLVGDLSAAIRSGGLPTAPTTVYGLTVDSVVRLVEHDTGIVHHALTVRVRRSST